VKVDGTILKEARERVFMSQEELAEALSMNPGVVIGLEREPRTEVRENLVRDLAEVLFVARADLTSHPEPPPPVTADEEDG